MDKFCQNPVSDFVDNNDQTELHFSQKSFAKKSFFSWKIIFSQIFYVFLLAKILDKISGKFSKNSERETSEFGVSDRRVSDVKFKQIFFFF